MSETNESLIPKWHRELELFSGIKPLLILEGNVLDQYRYPLKGSVEQDEIIPAEPVSAHFLLRQRI